MKLILVRKKYIFISKYLHQHWMIIRIACYLIYFAVPADHSVKMKENEKVGKYLDLVKELKKLWTMRVTEIPIVEYWEESWEDLLSLGLQGKPTD